VVKPNRVMQRRLFQKCIALSVLATTVVLPVWTLREGVVDQWTDELRRLKTQRLKVARALDVLRDNPEIISAVRDNPATVDTLTLSLLESLKKVSTDLATDLTLLSITDSEDKETKDKESNSIPHSIRIEFTAVLQRAIELLPIFDAVREVADWRLVEVRGCTLVRTINKSRSVVADSSSESPSAAVLYGSGISANCAMDVYYYPEIDG